MGHLLHNTIPCKKITAEEDDCSVKCHLYIFMETSKYRGDGWSSHRRAHGGFKYFVEHHRLGTEAGHIHLIESSKSLCQITAAHFRSPNTSIILNSQFEQTVLTTQRPYKLCSTL